MGNEPGKEPTDRPDDRFEMRTRSVLRASAEQLDASTRSKLTQARYAALAAAGDRPRSIWQWLAPISGAVATAAIVAVVMLNPVKHASESDAALTAADEMEIVTAEDSLEFYRDVEFYAWLDSVLEEAPPEENGA